MIGPMLGDAGEDAILAGMPTIERDPGSGEWLKERRLGEQWRLAGYMACDDCEDVGFVHSDPGLSPRESGAAGGRPAMPSTPASAGFFKGGGRRAPTDVPRGGTVHSHWFWLCFADCESWQELPWSPRTPPSLLRCWLLKKPPDELDGVLVKDPLEPGVGAPFVEKLGGPDGVASHLGR